ncbi:MAG: GLPGLI family protein [Flavobacteriaceae bacterium]|nr:GLPGLI family protein [Flavobacteriaceae bacterium]
MKYSFFISFLFIIVKLNAQEVIHVKYDLKDSRSLNKNIIETELFSTSAESIFIINDKILDKKTLKISNSGHVVGDTIDYTFEVYKKFDKGEIFSEAQFINLPNKIQVDRVDDFVWEKMNESKYILGYLCKKAITQFRGREYEVFYCPDIKSNDGPYKFSGLPGLILSVKEKNERLEFVATSIDLNAQKAITTQLDLTAGIPWKELLGRSKLGFWNSQADLANPVRYYSDEIEIYDINVDPLIEIVYEVYAEFTYKENDRYHKEKTLETEFVLSGDYTESNYKYLEKIYNNQGLTEFGRIKGTGTLYKNLIDSVYINEMEIQGKRLIIKDDFQKLNWEIHDRFDELLGYKVQKATLELEDNFIEAWFTHSIKIGNGPDQLYGLPGIILKTITKYKKADQINYTIAKSIKIKNERFEPEIPKMRNRTEVFNENQLKEYLKSIGW